MKGISLAVESIVIFIIAAAVLAILLYFFMTTANPSINIIQLKGEQTKWCNSYTTNDPNCDESGFVDVTIQDELANVCERLNTVEGGFDQCTGVFNIDCVKQCCKSFCPSSD